MKLRCSKLPLAFKCPASVYGDSDDILIEFAHEGGAMGSAVHAVLETLVRAGTFEVPDVRPVSLKFGVESEELTRLSTYGLHAWKALAQYFPSPQTEVELEDDDLSGHIDVLSLGEDWANLADWKSSYKQPDYYDQIMGYAKLVFSNYPQVVQVKATLIWLRDWSQDTILITRDDVEAWVTTLQNRVFLWDGKYTAGAHCEYCPRFSTCPARQALVRSALAEIGAYDSRAVSADADGVIAVKVLTEAALPSIVQMYREGKLSIVKGLLKQIDDLIHTHIAATGPIDLGNGRELALVPENRDTIEPLKAWPVLTQYLETEELAGCVKIGKTAMLDAIGDKAGKGQKAKAKAQVMAELESANAVTKTEIMKLRERKIEKVYP